MDMKEMQHC